MRSMRSGGRYILIKREERTMKKLNTGKKVKRVISTAIAAALMFSLVAGLMPVIDPAYAASEFKYASPFKKTGYSTYYHKAAYSGDLIVNGVDISDWQSKKCRFDDAKADGVDFSIMRVTWSSYGTKKLKLHNDDKFSAQYTNAKANGVMCGVYVFSQAKNATEGAKEAAYAIKRLKELGIGPEDLALPVYMDYEFAGGILGRMHGIKKTAATNAAVAFCNTIKAAGYTPGIYANTTFFGSYLATSQFAPDVDLWCAQYYKRNQSGVNYSKWQYSSSAKIDGMLSYTGLQGKIDVNFWYLNKNNASSSTVTKICGKTTLSVADAKAPKFKLYNGKTLLKEGTDYLVGGIRNNAAGNGYAYIKGIGKYGGYALVPITVASKTTGSADTKLTCANYLTKASTAMSTPLPAAPAVKYQKGKKYVVQEYLNVRKGPGTKYGKVRRSKLSKAMKKRAVSGNIYAVLKPGSKIKCRGVKGNWMKIKGGWICCKSGDDVYVK